MLPTELENVIQEKIAHAFNPREEVVDIMYLLQNHYGYLCDDAVTHAARFTGMTKVEIEELATFYDFIYREPVGLYVIHVCDGVVCWMHHEYDIFKHLCDKLGVCVGGTSADGLFTVLPTACLGNCHNAPAMLINGVFYDKLTPEKIDTVLEDLRANADTLKLCMCR